MPTMMGSENSHFVDYCYDEMIGHGNIEDCELDEAVFEFYKKEKIKQLKSKLTPAELNVIVNDKKSLGINKHEVKHGFSRVSAKYFSEVIEALTPDQRKVISDYGFGSLLMYEKCVVPTKFINWLAHQIDVRTSEIVVNGKFIHFNKVSVHKVLGAPIGGDLFIVDCEAGEAFVLSKFNLTKLPPVSFFGDKIKNNESLPDDDMFICFMMVALSCFLCPDPSVYPSTKYMIALKDLSRFQNIDWSLYIYEWLIGAVPKFCFGVGKSLRSIHTFGGCSYVLAVLYLDCLNFGTFDVTRMTPRILVWKGSMIKHYSDLDELNAYQYGKRCFRDIIDTLYCETNDVDYNASEHTLYTPSASGFRSRLECLFGRMLNTKVLIFFSFFIMNITTTS